MYMYMYSVLCMVEAQLKMALDACPLLGPRVVSGGPVLCADKPSTRLEI